MKDAFHEAKEALATAQREYTTVNSLNAVAAYGVNHACELAVRTVWTLATNTEFPYNDFPLHKPGRWVELLGIKGYYSPECKNFIDKLTGYALDEVRYEGTQAFLDHTKEKSKGRAGELIRGSERFINETIVLSKNVEVLNLIKKHPRAQEDRKT